MSTIIGFGHRSRSGKDTAAATIIKQFGRPQPRGIVSSAAEDQDQTLYVGTGYMVSGIDVRRYAFADALKREVNEAALQNGGMQSLIEIGTRVGLPGARVQRDKYPDLKLYESVVMPEWVKFDPNAPMDDPLCPLGKQRTLLQWWGTEYRRNQDEDYWVKQLVYTIGCEMPEFALVTDFRFPNEAKALNFKVKVDRDVLVNDHPSEHALDNFSDWDLVIKNDSDLETFQSKVIEGFSFIRDFVSGRTRFYSQYS